MWTQKNLPDDGPMSRPEIETVFQQFPWAKNYVHGRPVYRAYIQHVEPSLLWYERQKWYCRRQAMDEIGGYYIHQVEDIGSECIFLVDANGMMVNHAHHVSVEWRKYLFWGPKISWTEIVVDKVGLIKTTIADALKCLSVDEVATICFILSYWEISRTMIVYRLPNDRSLSEWIEAETKKVTEITLKAMQ